MSSTMLETQTCSTLHLSSREHGQLLPDAGSHDWSEAKFAEVAQLVRLASQHHASEYSRLKFGPKGCPVAYVPLSLQMPERVKQLQAHQARYATRQAWWLCEKRAPTPLTSMVIAGDTAGSPRLSYPSSVSDIQQELDAAISSTFVAPERWSPATSQDQPSMKTSSSHPINISPVVPLELLRVISAYLSPNDDNSPVPLDLPPSYFLDRVIARLPSDASGFVVPPSFLHRNSRPTSMAEHQLTTCTSVHSLSRSGRLSHLLWNSPTLRRALQLTASSHGHGKRSRPASVVVQPALLPVRPEEATLLLPRPHSQDETSSARDSLRRSHSTSSMLMASKVAAPSGLTSSATCEVLGASPEPWRSISHSDLQVTLDTSIVPASPNKPPPLPPFIPEPPSIGNMYLSSCPGKKVRLSGPVKGKCGVCRDLRMDFRRIKDYGVVCIVCCLDDEELELLGVPWLDYSNIADELGLDVLRIPTPEGLTPASIPDFDAQLTKLIKSYTLDGRPVLVHCRGGVGRAGLVACCWMLKLGLCGRIEPTSALAYTAPEDLPTVDDETAHAALPISKDTMQLVERVITVIRRRRSSKAIETYEQVRFLVDFADYQRNPLQGDDAQANQQDLV